MLSETARSWKYISGNGKIIYCNFIYIGFSLEFYNMSKENFILPFHSPPPPQNFSHHDRSLKSTIEMKQCFSVLNLVVSSAMIQCLVMGLETGGRLVSVWNFPLNIWLGHQSLLLPLSSSSTSVLYFPSTRPLSACPVAVAVFHFYSMSLVWVHALYTLYTEPLTKVINLKNYSLSKYQTNPKVIYTHKKYLLYL